MLQRRCAVSEHATISVAANVRLADDVLLLKTALSSASPDVEGVFSAHEALPDASELPLNTGFELAGKRLSHITPSRAASGSYRLFHNADEAILPWLSHGRLQDLCPLGWGHAGTFWWRQLGLNSLLAPGLRTPRWQWLHAGAWLRGRLRRRSAHRLKGSTATYCSRGIG